MEGGNLTGTGPPMNDTDKVAINQHSHITCLRRGLRECNATLWCAATRLQLSQPWDSNYITYFSDIIANE